MSETNDLSQYVNRLVELHKQIKEAKADVKVLTDAEKQLKQEVKKRMQTQGVDQINLKKGKISIRKSTKKPALNKKHIMDGMLAHIFNGDQEKMDTFINKIKEDLEPKESTSIALTGIKE